MLNEYRYIPALNPIIRYNARMFGNTKGIYELKRDVPLIVSLTSTEEHNNSLELALYSVLNQNIKPDRVILWLSDGYNLADLPYGITQFIKNGLEIRFIKNLGEYNKTIYPLKEFSNAVIVTALDSVYYSSNWLQKLYHSYISAPENIHVHIAHRVKKDKNVISPFSKWKKHINEESAEFSNFICGAGGVLYPPECFSKEAFREDIFLKNDITDSDLWFWFMGLLQGRKIRIVKSHIKTVTSTDIISLIRFNQNKKNKAADEQAKILTEYYGANILPKIEK